MIVSDVMSHQVEYVSADLKVEGVARLIFGRGINGLPVCKNKKVIGFITERDILSKFYPSMKDYIEDPFGEGDFESMEGKISDIFGLNAEKIMSRDPIVVTPDTPLLRAQSLMFVSKVGRLPVVNKKKNLVGMISKGDIFRAVVGEKLPFEDDEQFHDWLSRRYDLIVDQKKRLAKEIPDLVKLFRKENVRSILDVGCGTGVHTIALVKEGFNVVGIDTSSRMINAANEKKGALIDALREKTQFTHAKYKEYKYLDKMLPEKFDAAIFMGSGLPHVNTKQVFKEVDKVLNNKAIIICQVANLGKIVKINKGFYDFNIRKSPFPEEKEQAFLRFYDSKEEGHFSQSICVFAKSSKKWIYKGLRTMIVYPLNKPKLVSFLKQTGFTDVKCYGGEKGFYYDFLFRKPFKPTQSDVLVVVAKR